MIPFEYSVRVSRRARRTRIVVRPNQQVELVIPAGVSRVAAERLLVEKRHWVERSLQRFAEASEGRVCSRAFPAVVELPAIDCSFTVLYKRTDSSQVRVVESGCVLHLSGAVDDEARVGEALRRWLRHKAKQLLVPMLETLAKQHRFQHGHVTIRLQKSRWGSCSRSGNISLNARLLFFSPELARYVILHELAHLERMDHSPAFWAVVARCDRNYMAHRRELKRAGGLVPRWSEG